jgi:lysozyme
MSDRQRLIDQLIRDEGLRLKPYMDSVGTDDDRRRAQPLSDCGISNREAMDLLEHDVDAAIIDLARNFAWFEPLDPVRQRAVTNMRFQLGPTRFRGFKRMIRALSDGDYPMAASSARQSVWYAQSKQRAVRIVHMLLTGEDA